MTHQFTFVTTNSGGRKSISCSCGWQSAEYMLTATAVRAWKQHKAGVPSLDEHEALVNRFLEEN